MVRLNRIYTRTGDDGSTGLGDGTRLPKDHLRIEAYGTVDELSSVLGLCMAEGADGFDDRLKSIQNDLFDVGSDLCVPGIGDEGKRLDAGYVKRLEGWIDEWNERLQPLTSFILPGGSAAAARLHLGRTVCRRAERITVALAAEPDEKDKVNPLVIQYLNRLSDLLFVMARIANDEGRADVLWKPGAGAGQ